ncbi:MAG: hypothetical protein L6Q76_19575 [Polyangiaceae bacterium]|nr:hypothetical protein [Polyangiaceae bacterium]
MIRHAVTGLLVLGTSGCVGLLAPPGMKEMDAAYERRDEAYLEEHCGKKDGHYACKKLEALRAPAKIAALSCGEVTSYYENSSKEDASAVALVGRKLAECGEYTYLFERVVHWGNGGEGKQILIKLEEEGKPVEAEFVKYLASHKGPQFFPMEKNKGLVVKYTIHHISQWLVEKGHTQHCAAFAESATGANEWARTAVLWYFEQNKCKEGIPLATELLLDEEGGTRGYACEILGVIGDASVADKVKTLAETDDFSEVVEEEREGRVYAMKVYPVREACRAAYGKIKLRN